MFFVLYFMVYLRLCLFDYSLDGRCKLVVVRSVFVVMCCLLVAAVVCCLFYVICCLLFVVCKMFLY